jgi:TatD DNase family protein
MIDCHLHLQDPRLAAETEEIVSAARALGIATMVVNGTHPGDWDAVARLAASYPEVLPQFGLHPWRAGTEGKGWLERLEELLVGHPQAGVGEIGLDRWIRGNDPVRQREVFSAQLALARRLGRPVSVHCLRAWGALLECLAETPPSAGLLLHSYGGPVELVPELAARGAYFSLSGYFFREGKEAKLATFDAVPRDRLLLETDAPDMAPPEAMRRYRLRGRPGDGEEANHPANLVAVYDAVAARWGMSFEETVAAMRSNFAAWQGQATAGQGATARSIASRRESLS